jgi:hypothetical protein
MRAFARRLRRFTEHSATKLVLGLILMISAGAESYDTFTDDVTHLHLRAHHGLFLYALMNVLAALPGLFEGLVKELDVLDKKLEKETIGLAGSLGPTVPPEP